MHIFSSFTLLFGLILSFIQITSGLNINSNYQSDTLVLKGGHHFVHGNVKLKSLVIFPCTNITFTDFSSKIIINFGTLKILGTESCPINIFQRNHVKINLVFTLSNPDCLYSILRI